ncbi:superfamily II DNA/RNA helicase [Lachnotalea glycerini]|uniref:DEAD/DEAH box helicase n=1 Tax=Lachnotalea glycerini TaxID=1763509 RepID=A0A255I4J3_9FIRM|nr:DEAD/DEAH box helicase [Lachnotalea glycerini]PXV93631.1 superfamily II DNA/RNA helicase [Lachnotalea glycerini]RDY32579.1 DEAD/DEAH box helicase [Lachnotalea glycerini]
MDFREFGLDEAMINALNKEKIIKANEVQQAVFESDENKDLIVQSETGSGKTLAYLLPIYKKLVPIEKGMQALILVPTHELAMQVKRQVQSLSKNSGYPIQAAAIVGDVNISRQIESLKEKPQIVIGTTGRIIELIKKRKITAHTIRTIVIDEADKMLDKNNIDGVKAVLKCCMRDTKIVMFSASMSNEAIQEGQKILKDPLIIQLASNKKTSIPTNIKHIYFVVERRDKLEMLRKLASSMKPEKAMIFVNKQSDIEELTQKLQYHHYNAECIHGANIKKDRKKVIDDFKNNRLQYLIATDIAARGLHFEGVSAIYHISIPENQNDYLHRAGRTGRNQEQGLSVLIVTKQELVLINKYKKEFGIEIEPYQIYKGKIVACNKAKLL